MGAEPRDVLKLTLSGAGEELIATRKDADAGWTYAVGSAPPQAVAGRTLDDFLDRLRWLRAESLEADAAPAAPAARTVVLSGAAGELGRIDFLEDPSAPATASAPAAPERLLSVRSTWRSGLRLALRSEAVGLVPRAKDLASA